MFLFDLRGHGDSAGHTISFGDREALDVEAATQWVSQQPGGKNIGVLAYSMGAASVLNAVGDDGLPQVRSMILDSTYAEFAPIAREQMNFLPQSAATPLMATLNFYTRLELGFGLYDIAPRRFIGKFSPRPLLLIHGTADTLVPPVQAKMNFASAREPKSIYWIDRAPHCGGHQVAGKAYEKRVTDFFDKSLR